MVKKVLLFSSLVAFTFVACNDEMSVIENENQEVENAKSLMRSQDDSISGDTIVAPIKEWEPPVDLTPPPTESPDSIGRPESYPTNLVPTYPDTVEPQYPDTLVSSKHE